VNRTFSYGGDEVRTNNVSYPNLILRISKLESLPFLKKYCRSSSINTGFNLSIEERYEVDPDTTPDLISDSKGISFTPLVSWQANWKKGISSTIEVTYSETNSTNYAGARKVPSKIQNSGGSASLAYTFSAPRGLGLPFLKGLKFTSNLSVNLRLNYNRSTSYFDDLKKPKNSSSTFGANIGLSYSFSSSITGGANFDYSQNDDMNSDQNSRRVGLNIWTNINF
jgi:opacity protein-like surface antigen